MDFCYPFLALNCHTKRVRFFRLSGLLDVKVLRCFTFTALDNSHKLYLCGRHSPVMELVSVYDCPLNAFLALYNSYSMAVN